MATQLELCSEMLINVSKLCQELDLREQHFRASVELPYCSSNTFTLIRDSSKQLGELIVKQA